MIEFTSRTIMELSRMGMRKAFGSFIYDIAGQHKDLIVLSADTSSSANMGRFISEYPNQFYNIGIAEQNMTGIAAGLAKEGNNVFIVSFAPFVAMRNYESIRTLVGYMNLNVKIVALASGFSMGVQGNTHYCLEDISLMKTIPGMKILSPADVVEERKCLEYLADYTGPAYLRLTGIDGSPAVGSVIAECVRASRLLKKEGLSCAVYNVCQLKPFNSAFLQNAIHNTRLVVTVEEHYITGGMGGIVCEEMCSLSKPIHVLRIGVSDEFPHAGDYSYLQGVTGLNSQSIVNNILGFFQQ